MFAAMGREAWARNTWLWVYTHRWFADPSRLKDAAHDIAADPFPRSAEMVVRQCAAVIGFDALDRWPWIVAPTRVIAGAEDC